MATITQIKDKIKILSPAQFQELCDELLSKMDCGIIHEYGTQPGTGNTKKGNPDTYFLKPNGKYIFAAYTISKNNLYKKIEEDIKKCLNPKLTGLPISELDEIIYCHTSSSLKAGDDKRLHKMCSNKGVKLRIYGIDQISMLINSNYKSIARDSLDLPLDTNQIMTTKEFISNYDSIKMAAPLNTIFQFRNDKVQEIRNELQNKSFVILTGKPGVGKSRLALEVAKEIEDEEKCKVFCVKSNNLPLSDDLQAYTEAPGKYLFFIDDANGLTGLELIAEYTAQLHKGYNVKIIMTVRDYAKDIVIKKISKFEIPSVIIVEKFSDDEITKFVKINFQNENKLFIKKIISIAEGNPRIAYMAVQLYKCKNNIGGIETINQLYEAYYGEYIDKSFGNDKKLCCVAIIVSIFNTINFEYIDKFSEILKFCDISLSEFKSLIYELSNMEIVEVHQDLVAVFSDQCLANYLIYYNLITKKYLSLSSIIKTCYKQFRNSIVNLIVTIYKLYDSQEMREYCNMEISNSWNYFEHVSSSLYEMFIVDFHTFQPEKSLLYAKNEISKIEKSKFDVDTINFATNKFSDSASVLQILGGYQYEKPNLEYALSLLLEYCSKSVSNMLNGAKWLTLNYGLTKNSANEHFLSETTVSNFLLEKASAHNEVATVLALEWTKYYLNFEFEYNETDRNNSWLMYTITPHHNNQFESGRKACWILLLELYKEEKYHKKISNIIRNYANLLHEDTDKGIAKFDQYFISELLEYTNHNDISDLIMVYEIIENSKSIDIEYQKKYLDLLDNEEFNLYMLLKSDYMESKREYQEYGSYIKTKISNYTKSISSNKIEWLIKNIDDILSSESNSQHSYFLKENTRIIISELSKHKENTINILDSIVKYGSNISIIPQEFFDGLHKSMGTTKLYIYLNCHQFKQKNDFLYMFFLTLPKKSISKKRNEQLIDFFKAISAEKCCIIQNGNFRVLDKFLSINTDVYQEVSEVIFNSGSINAQQFFISLFWGDNYKPEELVYLFNHNSSLLSKIYFCTLKFNDAIDYSGTFLTYFFDNGIITPSKYGKYIWNNVSNTHNTNSDSLQNLWYSKHYRKYFNAIFNSISIDKFNNWRISSEITNIFSKNLKDVASHSKRQKWVMQYIMHNSNKNTIPVIFAGIAEMEDEDFKRLSIKSFLTANSDPITFEKLQLVSSSDSGSTIVGNSNSAGFIPSYQRKIKYLNSLLPLVESTDYYEQRKKIHDEIALYKRMIKKEEITNICHNLYM